MTNTKPKGKRGYERMSGSGHALIVAGQQRQSNMVGGGGEEKWNVESEAKKDWFPTFVNRAYLHWGLP